MIQIQVRNKVAVNLTPEKVIVCGNSDYEVQFVFDDEWASKDAKTARFVYRKGGRNYFTEVPFTGTIVKAPVLSDIHNVLVGVYAGDLITTTPAVVECNKSILCGSGTHKDPTPDVYNQLIELINSGGGSGGDGFSPIANVTQTDSGAVISITDKNGTTTATVTNGKDGADGFTPTVALLPYGDCADIVVTNKAGSKTVRIYNGENGAKGEDGTSATHSWNGTTLTITSASGTSSANLKGDKGDKGEKGDTGATGSQGATGAKGDKGDKGDPGTDGKDGLDATPVTPLFSNSIAECTDTTKFYVLPDGFIYAYLYKEASGPAYTNLAGAVQENTRLNSSGVAKELAGAITTGFIPVKQGDKVRVKGFDPTSLIGSNYPYVAFYTSASETAIVTADKIARGDGNLWTVNGDVYEYTPFKLHTGSEHSLASSITHIRINGAMTDTGADVIVTVNEEIAEGGTSGYVWANTGHAFVPADYESRILSLESHAIAIPASRIKAIEDTLDDVQTAKPWTGKKWVVVGDSLTQALNSDGTNANTDKYYHTHIAEETGITVANMGQGGTGYKKTDDSGYAFYQRIVNVPTDADVVTIFGSINDLSRTANYTIGEITDTGTETVCGCINTTLDTLFSVFPVANVGIITPMPTKYYNYFNFEADTRTQRVKEYCDKLMEICRRRSIPVLDMFHGSGMRAWDKSFRDTFYSNEDLEGDGERGGIHPDATGHAIMATKIKAFLESLL